MHEIRPFVLGLCAVALSIAAAHAKQASQSASFSVQYAQGAKDATPSQPTQVLFHLSGATGPGFLVQASLSPSFPPGASPFLGLALLDASGSGAYTLALPSGFVMPPDMRVFLRALYLAPAGVAATDALALGLGMPSERLTFNNAPGGVLPLPGTQITSQYAGLGLTVSALNKNVGFDPDKAIVFDSAAPTGGDDDLATPGPGAGNDTAFGNVLIVAENDLDADGDGRVDVPDDEAFGGVIRFTFDQPVTLADIVLVDVDDNSPTSVRLFNGVAPPTSVPIGNGGENSVQRIGLPSIPVTRVEVDLGGSGAVAELNLLACPTDIDFDESSTGVPLGFSAGTVLLQQLAGQGVHVSARSNLTFGGTHRAVVLDSDNPPPGDPDLLTPGPGIGNTAALGNVLILATNLIDLDGDGLVDVPDDDLFGGDLIFDFDFDVRFVGGTVLDVDDPMPTSFELFDAGSNSIGSVPLPNLGENSVQSVAPNLGGARRIVLHLGGSGALASLTVCPDFGS